MPRILYALLTMCGLSACATSGANKTIPDGPFLSADATYIVQIMPVETQSVLCPLVDGLIDCNAGKIGIGQGSAAATSYRTGNNPDDKKEFQYNIYKLNLKPVKYALAASRIVDSNAFGSATVSTILAKEATIFVDGAPGNVTLLKLARTKIPSSLGVNNVDHLRKTLTEEFGDSQLAGITVSEAEFFELDCSDTTRALAPENCRMGNRISVEKIKGGELTFGLIPLLSF